MVLFRCFIFLLLAFVLTACSTKPDKPEQFFTTNITADGIKQFAITIDMEARKKGNRGRGKGNGERKEGRNKNQGERTDRSKVQDKAEQIVNRHMTRNNFCTLGYEITEQFVQEGRLLIRGHCNEKAKR